MTQWTGIHSIGALPLAASVVSYQCSFEFSEIHTVLVN